VSHLRLDGQPASEGPLVVLPPTLATDAARLGAKVAAMAGTDAEFSVEHDGIAYRCARIASPATREDAAGWVLRQIRNDRRTLADLGMPDWLVGELHRAGLRGGLLLVTGPFASGKTTTAAACLTDWVARHGGVGVTFEDPPERRIAGFHGRGPIYQIAVPQYGFADAVRASRRWAYRFALIGEIRSHETAAETIQLALSGATIVATIHGAGPVEGLMALAKFAAAPDEPRGPDDRIAAAISGVLHQTLARDRPEVRYLSFAGRNAPAMRTKIINGQFHLLADDLEYQTRLRGLGRANESF
jgi:twitching motility protein PilT